MNEVFSDIPEAMANTLEILNKVEVYDIEHGPIMPFFPIPETSYPKKSGGSDSLRSSSSTNLPVMRTVRTNYLVRKERRK